MPSFIPATGITLHLVGVCVNRIGVERTFGWINRARRLAKDFEATIESSLAWLLIALAFLLTRRLARLSPRHS